MEIFSVLAMLTIFPFGATLIGAVYLWMFYKLKTTSCLTAGILWAIYSVYEYLMYSRVLCSGECNIRVDLLVIYPLLIVLSLIATVLYYRKKRLLKRSNLD